MRRARLARGALARAHQLSGKPAAAHGGHHGDAPHDVGLALLHARIKRACRRLGHAGIQRALKLLGKHARAPGKLPPSIKNHMNAGGVLINGLELILVTLLFHEDRTTNRKRVIVHLRRTRPATHFDGGFHGTPFACDGCRHHTTIEQRAQDSSAGFRSPTSDDGAWLRGPTAQRPMAQAQCRTYSSGSSCTGKVTVMHVPMPSSLAKSMLAPW